jgi:hypothetical protein
LGEYVFQCKENLIALHFYMPAKKLQQLRVAYLVAKRDDGLTTMTTSQLLADITAAVAAEESDWNAQNQTNQQELLSIQLLPSKLVEPSKTTTHDKKQERNSSGI